MNCRKQTVDMAKNTPVDDDDDIWKQLMMVKLVIWLTNYNEEPDGDGDNGVIYGDGGWSLVIYGDGGWSLVGYL